MLSLYVKLIQRRLRRRVLGTTTVPLDRLMAQARQAMAALSLQEERVLQVRSDAGKVVVLCRRADVGRCVFKYVSRDTSLGHADTYWRAMRLVRELEDGLFPRVLKVGRNYSLEEFVEGRPLNEGDEPGSWSVDVVDFLGQVRRLCEVDGSTQSMTSRDVRDLVKYYVIKALRPPPRVPASEQAAVLRALLGSAGPLTQLSQQVMSLALSADIPQTRMIDDLGAHNILRRADDGQLTIIDADYMRAGFWGFDCAWLLSTLDSPPCPVSYLEEAYVDICNDDFLGFAGGGRLIGSMLALLLEIRCLGRDRRSAGKDILRFRDRTLREQFPAVDGRPAPEGT